MNSYYISLTITLAAAALPCIAGVLRFRRLSTAAQIFLLLLLTGFLTELIAWYFAETRHNNMLVYNVSGFFQTILMCLFFNYSNVLFRKWAVGWYFALLGVSLGIIDILWLEPIDTFTLYPFIYQLIVATILTVLMFRVKTKITDPVARQKLSADFWLAFVMVNFGLYSMFNIAFYDYFTSVSKTYDYFLNYLMVVITAVFNIAFAVVYLKYPVTDGSDAD